MNNSFNIKLKDIFIGEIDGETESQKENFLELFYNDNSKYDEIISPHKFIISGKKGTGKTILASYIEKNHSNKKLCRIFNLKDFKVQQLIDLSNDNLDFDFDVVDVFWKWFIYIKLTEIVVAQPSKVLRYIPFTNRYKLEKFYKDMYNENIFKISNYVKEDYIKNVDDSALEVDVYGIVNASGGSQAEKSTKIITNFQKKRFYELIQSLENKLIKSIDKRDDSIIVIFDDLDELQGKIDENKLYRELIVKMLEIIKTINMFFNSRGLNVKLIVLLRSDVISSLQKYSSNLNKIVTSGQVNLYWIDKYGKNPEKHPIMDMILTKVQSSTKEYQNTTKQELYKILFPEKIKHKEVIDYLLDHSFGRPRDIIQYLNIIKKEYPKATSFKPEFFRDCAQEYSNWFYDELLNELNIHRNTEFVTDSLKLVNDFKKITFEYDHINSYFEANKSSYKHITDVRLALEFLYKFGVLGNSWPNPRRRKNPPFLYSWGYRKDANDEPNFNQTFVVHYGFRKKFSI